ncbi:MAG: hypothetical protein JRG95_06320, partial [Deltaproteobacteria bacterium]|nr:hypothetical protein [Deltaproteobacteria bacterium]
MNSDRLGNWLQVGANLGIIVGLVLVGVQLKQNTDLLRVQLLYEESQRFIEHEQTMIGENGAEAWAKSLTAPREMTLAERRVMESYLYAMTEQWRASYMLRELGVLDEEWKDRIVEETKYYLGNPFGRAWWKAYRDTTRVPPEMLLLVEEMLVKNPDFTLPYHDALMDGLPEE